MDTGSPEESREREDALLDAVQALLRSNDDLSSFAARVAHDLRSPLGAVIGQLELVELYGEDVPPLTATAVTSALAAAERMRSTLDDVLAYATLTLAPRLQDVDVRAVASAVLEDVAPQVAAAEATVALPDAVVVRTDPTLLRVLLQNLVANALVHAGPAPQVRLATRVTAGGWLVEVHDDGPGVPADLRDRVFEPLVRGSTRSGTGTGLATSARVAEALGGTLTVDDSPDLGGAVFRLQVGRSSTVG